MKNVISGTAELGRNAVGFDINRTYCALSDSRLPKGHKTGNPKQLTICADARAMARSLSENTISLSVTSPPYANLLNRKRQNKSRRGDARKNGQYLQVEQYSQRPDDLGTLQVADYEAAMTEIYRAMLPLMKPRGNVVVNIADMWWGGNRIPLHLSIIRTLESAGFVFKNTIIWDRTNIVNNIGIFGWPSNYITMGTTFEYLLHFYRPEEPVPDLI
jgi:DNA modification methylase